MELRPPPRPWSLSEKEEEKRKPPTFTMTCVWSPGPALRQALASFLGGCYFPFCPTRRGSARRVEQPLPAAQGPQASPGLGAGVAPTVCSQSGVY